MKTPDHLCLGGVATLCDGILCCLNSFLHTSMLAGVNDSLKMEALGDEILCCFTSFLQAKDLVNLSLTCKRFGAKCLASPAAIATPWSLVEEAARQQIIETQTAEEKQYILKRSEDNWIDVAHQLELLRAPLSLNWRWRKTSAHGVSCCSSICDQVMRVGCHFVSFTIDNGNPCAYVSLGIMRPQRQWKKVDRRINNCYLYDLTSGYCFSGSWDKNELIFEPKNWDGRVPSREDHVTIGLLLNLGDGTLVAYKNGRRLGKMADNVNDDWCWAVTMTTRQDNASVHIERSPLP